jgi:hypothetical protein
MLPPLLWAAAHGCVGALPGRGIKSRTAIQRVLYDDMIQEDIKMRNPNSDAALGIDRDPITRQIRNLPP